MRALTRYEKLSALRHRIENCFVAVEGCVILCDFAPYAGESAAAERRRACDELAKIECAYARQLLDQFVEACHA